MKSRKHLPAKLRTFYPVITIIIGLLLSILPLTPPIENFLLDCKISLSRSINSDNFSQYTPLTLVEVPEDSPRGSLNYANATKLLKKAESSGVKAVVFLAPPGENDVSIEDKKKFLQQEQKIRVFIPYYLSEKLDNSGQLIPITPNKEVASNAVATGFILNRTDRDILRKKQIAVKVGEEYLPSMELIVAGFILGIPPSDISYKKTGIYMGKEHLDTDKNHSISYITKQNQNFPLFSYEEIITAKRLGFLRGKILIVGPASISGAKIKDMGLRHTQQSTPYFTASTISLITNNQITQEAPPLVNYAILIIFTLIIGYFIPIIEEKYTIAAAIFAIVTISIINYSVFLLGLNLSSGPIILTTIIFSAGLVAWRKYMSMSHSSRFVPEKLIKILQQGDPEADIQMVVRKVAVLFSDIKGYTTLSERYGPSVIMERLNEYLGVMNKIIEENDGVVLNYQGDSIMAIFGLDECSEKRAALQAVKSSTLMQEALNNMRHQWKMEFREMFVIGMGISVGEIALGSLGSDSFCQYTAIGDTVNLAARLQAQCKELRVPILVDENTFHLIRKRVKASPVQQPHLKGKYQVSQIYHIEGYKPQETPTNPGIKASDSLNTILAKKMNYYKEVKEYLSELS